MLSINQVSIQLLRCFVIVKENMRVIFFAKFAVYSPFSIQLVFYR